MIHAPSGLRQMSIFTTAAQNHLSSSVVVFIKVLDINDNVPRLARDYQPYICEGTQAGEVCILWCTDVHDLLYNSLAMRISVNRHWTYCIWPSCYFAHPLNIRGLTMNLFTAVQQHTILHWYHCQLLNESLSVIFLRKEILECIWLLPPRKSVMSVWHSFFFGNVSFVSQLIQLLSAVDPDEPVEGHHFYFSMVPEKHINPNFTIRDNQGYSQLNNLF